VNRNLQLLRRGCLSEPVRHTAESAVQFGEIAICLDAEGAEPFEFYFCGGIAVVVCAFCNFHVRYGWLVVGLVKVGKEIIKDAFQIVNAEGLGLFLLRISKSLPGFQGAGLVPSGDGS